MTARWTAFLVGLAILAIVALVLTSGGGTAPTASTSSASRFTTNVDPGTPLHGQAPDFTLVDQSGRPVSLHAYRRKVVLLGFSDSECTTVCPLTTTAMVEAKRLLGAAGAQVQLLGIDANPSAISIKDVRAYTEAHGMIHDWRFLTGSLPALQNVWRAYHIYVAIQGGQIDHTPALYVISPQGALAKVYVTQMSYSSVDQQAQLLAQEASSLLPAHPNVLSHVSLTQIPPITPADAVALARPGGGTVGLGPGQARLVVFFATWDSEVTNLAAQMEALNAYHRAAAREHLPPLAAVDEASVEPSPAALPAFLHTLRSPLAYPVGIDAGGRVADGYGVQDEPWYALVSASGGFLWYDDISTNGWLSTRALVQHVRAALARAPRAVTGAELQADLAGSPPPLKALHDQSGQLLGGQADLSARLRALRGYPVVLNVWASWCPPCRQEFSLFSSASARYGRDVAFVGADTSDSAGDARAFLAQHPVSYPSYQTTTSQLGSLAAIEGLPTTVFINRAGKAIFVHTGQYESQGALDGDVQGYALGG